ncbi:pyridoxamine 5'-phosphate oxidase family protein [Mitsuokella sp.]|uniref:pyridoxamine 5'-phosphate oxidase family protein n=1 Tax=Mitsuokella sp. TaxID=2049034 RepID=UPI003D7C9076
MKKSILKDLDMNDGMAVTLAMLKAHPMQYLGVIGLDQKPKVKAFEFKYEENGKLWFDTIRGKETWKEILQNPEVELTVADSETMDWIRISGKVRIQEDEEHRQKAFAASPILRKYYSGPEAKKVVPFTLDNVQVEVASLEPDIGTHIYRL